METKNNLSPFEAMLEKEREKRKLENNLDNPLVQFTLKILQDEKYANDIITDVEKSLLHPLELQEDMNVHAKCQESHTYKVMTTRMVHNKCKAIKGLMFEVVRHHYGDSVLDYTIWTRSVLYGGYDLSKKYPPRVDVFEIILKHNITKKDIMVFCKNKDSDEEAYLTFDEGFLEYPRALPEFGLSYYFLDIIVDLLKKKYEKEVDYYNMDIWRRRIWQQMGD